ncbi:amino acid transporter heavy chain SLC3A2 isoform 2-T3 [Spinachia spinachia]
MTLNAGVTGYGSVTGSDSAPLLVPQPQALPQWLPLTKEELEVAAGGAGWRRARRYLVLLFWLTWLAMLTTAIAVVVKSPRPVEPPLKWWQKTLFYRLERDVRTEMQGLASGGAEALSEHLQYLRSLGIGALILEGQFEKKASYLSLNGTGERFGPQIDDLMICVKANFKVLLDVCDLDLMGPQNAEKTSNLSATEHYALRFWLEQGVAGFVICDTDAAYSEQTLLGWNDVFKEFSSADNESHINFTLVDTFMRSILPSSQHLLSETEVADAIETHLQTTEDDIWLSWTVGGKASHHLKKLLLVLVMTLPGSPVVWLDEDINQVQNRSLNIGSLHGDPNETSVIHTDEWKKHSASALFTTLSHTRAREEALLFGSFTFLPFNSSNSSLPFRPSPPILAYLRSWGCVHFLVVINIGSKPNALGPAWAGHLPKVGVFVANTGMARLGSTTLDTLELRPHEAILIKLFEAGSYS